MIIKPEEWLPIKGYIGSYEVSSLGRVRSLNRVVIASNGKPHPYKGRTLSREYRRGERAEVVLRHGGQRRRFSVAHLVADAFIRRPQELRLKACEVQHKDGDKDNCKVENLQWAPRYTGLSRSATEAYSPRCDEPSAHDIAPGYCTITRKLGISNNIVRNRLLNGQPLVEAVQAAIESKSAQEQRKFAKAAQVKRWHGLSKEGFSLRDIARQDGVSPSTVWRHLNDWSRRAAA